MAKFVSPDMVLGKADDTVRLIRVTLYSEVTLLFIGCPRCVPIYTEKFWRWIQLGKNRKLTLKFRMCLKKVWLLDEDEGAHKMKQNILIFEYLR
jgi:hypothetical protein